MKWTLEYDKSNFQWIILENDEYLATVYTEDRARIMTAAPDMREALLVAREAIEYLVKVYNEDMGFDGGWDDWEEVAKPMEKIDNTLRRANPENL